MFFTKKRLTLYLGGLIVLQLCTLVAAGFSGALRGRYIDLRAFYTAGFMLRSGHAADIYNYAAEQHFQTLLVSSEPRALPMMPPPFTALPFVPLSFLSFWHAYAVFAVINVVLLLACIALLRPWLGALSARWRLAPALLFLSFLPAAIALILGQLSFVLLLLYCACFVALRRRQDVLAGVLLAVALIKFQVALPVALLFLLWRQWRFIAGFTTGATLLTALSIRIVGAGAFSAYLRSLYTMTHSVTAARYAQLHYAILPHEMPNLYGLFFVLTRGAAWSHLLILALSLALFLWTVRQRPSLPLALLTAMLVSYHLFYYDLTLLLLPLPLVFDHLLRAPAPDGGRRDYRLLITQISLGAILLAPLIRFMIEADQSFLLTLPLLGLTLTSSWWPALHGLPQAAPIADAALDLAPAT